MKYIPILFLCLLFSSCGVFYKSISSYKNKSQIKYSDLTISKTSGQQLIEKFNNSTADYSVFMDFTGKPCDEIPGLIKEMKAVLNNPSYTSELTVILNRKKMPLSYLAERYAQYDLPKEVYYLDLEQYKGGDIKVVLQLLGEFGLLDEMYMEFFYVYDNKKRKFVKVEEMKVSYVAP